GEVIVLEEPLSFWGAYEPRTGAIIDVHHPQRGASLTGRIVLMRESRGSGSAPGAIAEAIRLGTGPAGLILVAPDINLAVGAAVAATLYGRHCPVLAVSEERFAALRKARHLSIADDGAISVETG
ncbi:MAG: DUF126 domain-containing protein, partial [Alphaproteobacteria bacterium]|nr:DUF126 domain-containing protein [Alphaproteobacteria bacterium]